MRIAASSTPQAKAAPKPPDKPATTTPPTIEADVDGRLDAAGQLATSGQVTLSRVFMERLFRQITRKPEHFGPSKVLFNAKTGTYSGSVQLKVHGFPLTLEGDAVPMVDGNQPAVQLKNLRIKIGPFTLHGAFFTRLAVKELAKQISNGTLKAEAAPNGVLRIDPDSLLHEIKVLPYDLHLDSSHTQWSLAMAPSGDVHVKLATDGVAPPQGPGTPRSDMGVTLDEAAALNFLQPRLAPGFELSDVKIGAGTLTLNGRVEVKPLSDVINAGKALLAAIAASAGRPVDPTPSRAMIPLTLTVRLEGNQAVLTPSLAKALPTLEKTLTDAGAHPVREGDSLRFDLVALGAKDGLQSIQATPGQLDVRAATDIPALIHAPILRGEA
ncbi:MAG TPA: hypothetical protein V6D47_12475 [Oscillatoriaceae cyanobacterium]